MESLQNIKLGVFGGSQGVGKLCIVQALAKGYKVVLLARDPSKLNDIKSDGDNLKIIQGDVNDIDKVRQTVEGNNVIINSLGGWDDVCSKGTEKIIQAMIEKNVKRLITCTSLGCGDSYDNCSFFTKAFIWGVISKPIADKNIQEKLIINSNLDWTIVRPSGLVDKPATNNIISEGVSGGRIPRADVANFMIQQILSDSFLHKTVSISSP